jgi:hypothetical protein
MAYCTLADLKLELGIETLTAGDDTILSSKIVKAQQMIDAYTRRVWEAAADTTRYYTVGVDTDGRDLLLDTELAAAPTTVKTNADATSPLTIPSTDYVLLPRNRAPYYGIRILGNSAYDWRYTNNPEKGIEIVGKFAYSPAAPADIAQACIRLAGFLYRIKDTNAYDVSASAETGQLVVPKGTPADVLNILKERRKPTL